MPRSSRYQRKAEAGEFGPLSPDEARCPLLQTLRTTLGLKGLRPVLGNLDCHEVLYVFGALNLVTVQLTTRVMEHPKTPAQGQKTAARRRRVQGTCARQLRDIARVYPAAPYPRVVLEIDDAPRHKGPLIAQVLKAGPMASCTARD